MDDDQITLEFGRVISVTASGSTRATTIQLAAVGSEGDDDGAERGDAVEVLQREEYGIATGARTALYRAGILRSLSEANALVVLGHDQGSVAAGEPVTVWLFDGLT